MTAEIPIGDLIPTKIPGYADSADIQAALRLYHYGSYTYSPSNTSPANLVSPSIAKTLYDLDQDILALDSVTVQNDIFTAKGQILTATASNSPTVLNVGTNNQFLIANSGTGSGLEWSNTLTAPSISIPTISGGITLTGATTGSTVLQASSTAAGTITLPAVTGTVVTTGDTGTVTGTMIASNTIVNADINSAAAIAYSKLSLSNSIVNADINTSAAIANSKLANSSITVGSTTIALGATSTTLAGLTSVTSTSFIGALTGNADTVTNGLYTTGSYANPSWITSLGWSKITGTPTTLSGYGITNAQPLDADLTAIAGLVGTSGLLKKTAADTWTLDTSAYLIGNQTITLSGDATGSGATAITVTLANSGVGAGTYKSVTVDTKGRVTSGTNPTTLSGYGITDAIDTSATAQTKAGNLTAAQFIRSGGSSGQFLKADGSVDSNTYLTTGTASSTYAALSGATFTGAVNFAAATTSATSIRIPHTANIPSTPTNGDIWTTTAGIYVQINGATVGPLASSAGTLSNPMTTLGDTIYGGASGAGTRLAGNTSTTRTFLGQTGTGSASAAPSWTSSVGTGNVVLATSPTISGGTHTGLTSLGIRDTSAAFDVTLAAVSSPILTAARTLTLNLQNADRTVSLAGNLTISAAATVSGTNTGDQTITLTGDVTGTGTGSFATALANSGVTAGTYNDSATAVRPFTVDAKGRITSIGTAVTITPAWSSIGSKPTTLSGFGITDGLSNSSTSTQSGYFGDIYLYDDSTPSHYLQITNSANLTLARLLSINVNDADRTISLSGNLTVSGAATISGTNSGDQTITLTGDVTGTGTGSFATTLANSGVTASTYKSVTVNAKGLVTAGTNPTTLSGYGITDALDTSATAQTKSGTLTAASFIPSSSTAPTNGIYLPAANTVGISSNSAQRMTFDANGSVNFTSQVLEAITVSATAATGTVTYDVTTNKNILYYTSNATGNWTLNVRGNSTTTLNTLMATGQSLTVVFMNTNGATAYYSTAFQIDGVGVTPKWQNAITPASGNSNSIDVYTYNIVKTAASTYTVFASQARYA